MSNRSICDLLLHANQTNMAKLNIPENFEDLRSYVTGLFTQPLGKLVVDITQQQREIELLKETVGGERFFFLVDLTSFEITECHGVQQWLGYPDKEFSLKQYWSLIHPGKQKALMTVALQLYTTVCTGQVPLAYMVQRYSSMVAIRHYNGNYLLFKKNASIFQYDEHNRLLAYMNEFTRIGEYNGEPLAPNFFNSRGGEEKEHGDEVLRKTMQQFLGMKIFSVQELEVARKIAYQPGIRQAEIAVALDIAPSTVETYFKRFLAKAREYFHADFGTVQEAATYLRREGLV